jgi:hypothetical protein
MTGRLAKRVTTPAPRLIVYSLYLQLRFTFNAGILYDMARHENPTAVIESEAGKATQSPLSLWA